MIVIVDLVDHVVREERLEVLDIEPLELGVCHELFFADDPYVDQDAVFGVRDALVVEVKKSGDGTEAKRYSLASPFALVEFDFRLARR